MATKIVRVDINIGDIALDAYTKNEPHPVIPNAFINYLSGPGMARAIDLSEGTTRAKSLPKALKASLGEGFTTRREKFKMSSGGVTSLNLWTTDAASTYFLYHARYNNNERAWALTEALAGTSLDLVANDAFGRQYESGMARASIELRFNRVFARNLWTDTVRDRMIQLEYYWDKLRVCNEFKVLTIKVNMSLFNQPHFKCDRDNMGADQQQLISAFETVAARKAKQHPTATPEQIVDMALLLF